MLHHQQCLALGDGADQFDRLRGLLARHAGGRFVEEDDLRPGGQGHADFQRALLGIGEIAGEIMGPGFEPNPGQRLGRFLVHLPHPGDRAKQAVPDPVAREDADAEVLEHAEAMEDVGDLERARQPCPVDAMGLETADAASFEHDFAGRGREHAGDQVEEGGFAGAVGTDDRMPLARPDIEVEALDDLDRAEGLGQSRQPQCRLFSDRGHHAAPPSAATSAVPALAWSVLLQSGSMRLLARSIRAIPPTRRIRGTSQVRGLAGRHATPKSV